MQRTKGFKTLLIFILMAVLCSSAFTASFAVTQEEKDAAEKGDAAGENARFFEALDREILGGESP